jgi:predicted amidohydrolase YtcJ
MSLCQSRVGWRVQPFSEVLHANKIFTSGAFPHVETGVLSPKVLIAPVPSGYVEAVTSPANRSGFLRARRVLSLSPGAEGDSLWWEHGRVRQVGPAALLAKAVPAGTPVFECPRALVTPGLVDGHTHLALWALNRRRVQLAGARTLCAAVDRVAAAVPFQNWVIGQGWDANRWEQAPDRHHLDRVQSVPVYLDSLDVHAAWLNTAALRIAGIDRNTPDPFGGRIVRDGSGDPTGVLLERAVELVTPFLPQPSEGLLDLALQDAQTEAHRLGLTGIHDVESMATLDAFRRMETADTLRLRVLFHPPVAALPDLVTRRIRSGQGSEWLTIGGVKMFLDGSLGSRTAWMLQPYRGSRERGMPITNEAEARIAMTTAADAGIASTVHAIGDAAVRRALDLMEGLPAASVPHRIEHFQCVDPADLGRAARAGLVVSMQPAHLLTDIPLIERHWGSRGQGAYAFKSLRRLGTQLVFGSDVPVASLDPREGIYAALERRAEDGTPPRGWRTQEKLDLSETIAAYTVNAAAAAGSAAHRGRLAPGFDADLVAWSFDPAAERDDGEAVRAGRAVLTVVGGEVVMQA